MRILNTNSDTAIKNIILYLKVDEAKELYDSIGMLLEKNDFNSHEHIDDTFFEHEITVVLYNEQHMESLNERSKKIFWKIFNLGGKTGRRLGQYCVLTIRKSRGKRRHTPTTRTAISTALFQARR